MKRLAVLLALLLTACSTVWANPSNSVPRSATPGRVHVTAVGDIGANANSSAMLNGMRAALPDMALALGDLSYGTTGQEQAWCDFVKARMGTTPFELLAGNHESNGMNGNIGAFAACLPNVMPGIVGQYAQQYYLDVPATNPIARFVMISPGLTYPDGTWQYPPGSARYNWTAAAIDGARANGIQWVVVGAHYPCLTVGKYACAMGADAMNLLISKRVDLVLTGHDHGYQRSKQLAISASCPKVVPGTYSASCVASAGSSFPKGSGTVFNLVATGGAEEYIINGTDPEGAYFVASSGANKNPTWGFLDLVITNDTLTAKFVRTSGGTLTDTYTISKSVAARDDFSRTLTSGWGTAPVGGPWTTAGATSVSSGAGRMRLGAGASAAAALGALALPGADTRLAISPDKVPTGSGLYVWVAGRRNAAGSYRLRLVLKNSVTASLSRVTAAGAETVIAPAIAVPGVSVTAGTRILVRVLVTGTTPSTIRAKVWPATATEPSAWQLTASDSTAGFGSAGGIGINAYLSSSATNAPITTAFDDLGVSRV